MSLFLSEVFKRVPRYGSYHGKGAVGLVSTPDYGHVSVLVHQNSL